MKDAEHVTRIRVQCVGVNATLKRPKFRCILIRNDKTVPANGNGSKEMVKERFIYLHKHPRLTAWNDRKVANITLPAGRNHELP